VAGVHLADRAAGLRPARRARRAKVAALAASGGSLPLAKRLLVGVGIQPLSATAVFMAYEIVGLYPEIGRSALTLPLFAAALMEHCRTGAVPLCPRALGRNGRRSEESKGGIA
jgi:hypothetical protein